MREIKIRKRVLALVFALSVAVCGILARPVEVQAAGRNFPNISSLNLSTDNGMAWIVVETSDPLYTYRLYYYDTSIFSFANKITGSVGKFAYSVILQGGKTCSLSNYRYNSESGKWAGGEYWGGFTATGSGVYGKYEDGHNRFSDVVRIVGSTENIYSVWPDGTTKLFFPATRQTLESTLPSINLTGVMKEIVGLIPLLVVLIVSWLGLRKSWRWLLTVLRRG